MEKTQQDFHHPQVNSVPSFENDYYQDRVKLTQSIDISELSSGRGTDFEIANDELNPHETVGNVEDLFCDESLINSLSLGAGNGLFDDDSETDLDDGGEPFEKLSRKMVDVSGDGGVLKMEVHPGVGGIIPTGAIITFHYNAFLEYLDEPFDSTYLRNKTERKKLDGPDLLPGLNIALKTMRKNETSRFLIKSHYAFGKMGCPPRIPGNETLFYEIHLISIIDACAADTYDEQEHLGITFQEKLKGARGYHRKGNDLYRDGNLLAAKNSYMRAAWIMEDTKLKNEEEEQQRGSVLVKVRNNLAQVFLDLNEPAQACTQCKHGLSVTGVFSDELISKLHYRFGKAKTMLCDFVGALHHLRKAQHLKPHNADISAALESLLNKKMKYETQEKFMYTCMFELKGKKCSEGDPSSKNDKERRDENKNIIVVRPEFERIVEKQVLDFVSDPNITELPFPNNLSRDEIACVAAAGKAAGLLVTVRERGLDTFLKLEKNKH